MTLLINQTEFVPNCKYYVITETYDILYGVVAQIKIEESGTFVLINPEAGRDVEYMRQIRLAGETGIYTDELDAQIDLHQSIMNKQQ